MSTPHMPNMLAAPALETAALKRVIARDHLVGQDAAVAVPAEAEPSGSAMPIFTTWSTPASTSAVSLSPQSA